MTGLRIFRGWQWFPKGKAGHIAYVSDFIEEAKAAGLVKQTIDQANLRGLQVAPLARSIERCPLWVKSGHVQRIAHVR